MNAAEAALAARLCRMQRLATGLVALMAVAFVTTSFLRARYPYIDVIWAFSEAALIGGLADWFAVTALFRRPLGLPIPHTAIVPNRKNEIGRALARFVAEHFLARDVIERRLSGIDLAARLGAWMRDEQVAKRLGRDAATALDWLVRGVDSKELRLAAKDGVREVLRRIPPSALAGVLVDVLASGNHAQALVDQLVRFGRDQLERNKDRIRARVHDRSPWWLPRFVDEEIYDQLVGEVERILNDIGDDDAHPARRELNERLASLKHSLGDDPELVARSAALRDELLEHPAMRELANDVLARAQQFVHAALMDADSSVRMGLERQLATIGHVLEADAAVRERVNRWLYETILYVVVNYRAPLSEIISDTVEQWDAGLAARRIELHIGRDLQFIRINGTLVGGLVGVILYFGWEALTG
jgi:uncharacterized membrane-anchored protein YjiN (DUF445 family)